jgi:hypothetical protein
LSELRFSRREERPSGPVSEDREESRDFPEAAASSEVAAAEGLLFFEPSPKAASTAMAQQAWGMSVFFISGAL